MASYNDDSSSDEDLDVQTNVTLGYATDVSTGDDVSHAGGHPAWLDPQVKPSGDLAKCKICNNNMSLLLQLHADLQQHFPDDQRRLFIWCCRRKQCSKKIGSIRAFREVKKAKTPRKSQAPPATENRQPKSTQPPLNLGNQLFGGSPSALSSNMNPFATSTTAGSPRSNNNSSNSSGSSNPFSTASLLPDIATLSDELGAKPPQPPTQSFADKLKISSAAPTDSPDSLPWPPESEFPQPLPHFFFDAESEYLDSTSSSSAPGASTDPSSSSESKSNSRITDLDDASSAAEKDLYESPHDKTFDHFTRVLSQNPEQILRYEFRGLPLLYSSTDQVAPHFVLPGHMLHSANANQKVKTAGPVKGIPSCQYCGAARAFEMQLVPYLIFELEKDNEEAMKLDGSEGMEWGTVIVGTCSRNCGDERHGGGKIVFREEWVGVQWEEGGTELKQKR